MIRHEKRVEVNLYYCIIEINKLNFNKIRDIQDFINIEINLKIMKTNTEINSEIAKNNLCIQIINL